MTFENLGINNLLYRVDEIIKRDDSVVSYPESLSLLSKSSEVSSSSVSSGELVSDLLVSSGFIRSFNYVAGTSGWTINADGSVEFDSGYFRGDITGASGTFSGTLTGGSLNIPDLTTASSFHIDASGNAWWGTNIATGYANASAKILATGEATFKSATIGNWSVNTTSIYTGTEDHSGYTGASGDLTFYSNGTDASIHGFNFYIDTTGVITAKGAVLDGTTTLDGRAASILADAIDASGHFADNAIDTANGDILGEFTFGVSGALQIGTYSNGVSGDLKLSPNGILARDSSGATTFSINGTTGVAVLNGLVVGTNVGLGTAQDSSGVTTIIGSTVTTSFVNALEITAMGIVTAGAFVVGTSGYIRGGQTDYNTDTGFFLGYSGGAYKFSIGNPTGNYLTWDGSNLEIKGIIKKVAGDVLFQSANTNRQDLNIDSIWRKIKDIKVYKSGSYRVKFDLTYTDGTVTGYGRIYVNGSAVGTQRTATGAWVTWSEDITVANSTDDIQLYTMVSAGGGGQGVAIRNFQLYVLDYDSSLVVTD